MPVVCSTRVWASSAGQSMASGGISSSLPASFVSRSRKASMSGDAYYAALEEVMLRLARLNGEVVQSERTKDLIFDIPTIVSYISQYVTLEPGDVIFTGTPGTTRAMKAGDVVEIEVEGVGVLRNRVR